MHSYKRHISYGLITAYVVVSLLLFTAIFAEFIANDRPIIGKSTSGEWVCTFCPPVSGEELDWAIYPIIRFSSSSIDLESANYARPWTKSDDGRIHFLGTDQIGRDIAAGLIYGCRLSFLTAIVAAVLALIIGIILGSLAGYFGNNDFRLRRKSLWWLFASVVLGLYLIRSCSSNHVFVNAILGLAMTGSLAMMYRSELRNGPQIALPLDSVIMRLLELMTSLPGLLILLAVSAMIESKTAFTTAVVIGLLRWTRIAQIARNECLRLKGLNFIQSAKALGLGDVGIIVRHVLPNMWQQLLVVVVFSVASFILLESALSFLGIGVALENQTWGSILSEARRQISAWWLAIFPGMMIFLSVLSINRIGESWRVTSSSSSS